ncbi:TRAP transporter small permease [Thalassovita taeanensis]|uniref:TRAP transporter small permease protein n=1 Tax=Thalassovita taeanensis TaxID=657014 RepID=A0A1H9J5M2_9RHOB|nr:TRAP transporter small permease [Thalassovita taeanensis]SEQ82184.1 TRAP-type C4-dicarboxylate transport system, small permease component [Thalassovita taeanensis]
MKPTTSIHASQEPAAKLLPDPKGRFSLRTLLACLGGVLLLGMMGLTVVDVIGRYLFNAPLLGAMELTEVILAAVIFLGLTAVSLSDGHVTVDLLTDRMPIRWHPWRLALTGVFSGVVLSVVAWRIWIYASQIGGYGGSTTSLSIPIAPLGYFCAICAGIGAVLSVAVPLYRLILWLKHRT